MNTASVFRIGLVGSVSLAALLASPGMAQTAPAKTAAAAETNGVEEIVVTAQRTAQSLQDVPIAISAFTAETLARQQIQNSSDLQLTLPNITFTKTNFTASSFTIRGVGDLCTGTTCDAATGIHTNDLPLFGTRLFETEFFDLERVEVLRGPQGTLFGRNATSGVVNFVTAKPDARAIHAQGDLQYGNYNSVLAKGMFNLPITDRLAVRLAGVYLRRDGFTTNTFNNTKFDNRNLYAIRGSVRWEPTDNTTVDFMGYYFREKDNRARIQKQLCNTDPTGVLGCLPGAQGIGITNNNATLGAILTSREFFILSGIPNTPDAPLASALSFGSVYGPNNAFTGRTPIADVRTANTAFTPNYLTSEQQYMLRIKHDFGSFTAQASGMYQSNYINSQQDYFNQATNPANFIAGFTGLQALANGPVPSLLPVANALIPNGPNGPYCTSLPATDSAGVYGGKSICGSVPLNFDQSSGKTRALTAELIVTSKLDGPFNFLLGGIYTDLKATQGEYFVNGVGLDYASGVLGSIGGTSAYLATPFYDNRSDLYTLRSYGLFAEGYLQVNDKLKVTVGVRYNNDRKFVSARQTLLNCPNLIGSTTVDVSCADFDNFTPGRQDFAVNSASFSAVTGRAVIDYKISDESLLYFSYSRGYKSGGINPPLLPGSGVPNAFSPEFVNAFEIGSKNTFLDGTLRANLTAFYYQYKGLQISSIQSRTSVNQNINANIYGVEAEFILQPVRAFTVNLTASYLHATVSDNQFLVNPADPSGGQANTVIVKDLTNAAACAVTSAAGQAAVNGFVNAVNAGVNESFPGLNLQPVVAFPTGNGLAPGVTGAFGLCDQLAASAPAGINVNFIGTPVNVKGNQLPQAPSYKFSAGAQYVIDLGNNMSITPRADLAFTGNSYGSIQNTVPNRIPSYYVINAQVQLNGANDRWYARAFVQNMLNNNATTGQYVTDQTSGLFTNIFTLEPRRFGIAAGFKF